MGKEEVTSQSSLLPHGRLSTTWSLKFWRITDRTEQSTEYRLWLSEWSMYDILEVGSDKYCDICGCAMYHKSTVSLFSLSALHLYYFRILFFVPISRTKRVFTPFKEETPGRKKLKLTFRRNRRVKCFLPLTLGFCLCLSHHHNRKLQELTPAVAAATTAKAVKCNPQPIRNDFLAYKRKWTSGHTIFLFASGELRNDK